MAREDILSKFDRGGGGGGGVRRGREKREKREEEKRRDKLFLISSFPGDSIVDIHRSKRQSSSS